MEKKVGKSETISVGTAIFMLVACMILGSVFTFGMQYWNAEINREDAIRVEATYENHIVRQRLVIRTRTRGVDVFFTDNDMLHIDASCTDNDLLEALDDLPWRAKVIMLVHPNSDTILDMRVEGESILDFDDTQKVMGGQNTGFLLLGIFMYFCAVYSLYLLLRYYFYPAKNEAARIRID